MRQVLSREALLRTRWLVGVAALCSMPLRAQPVASDASRAIVARAISASGGADALTGLRSIAWRGAATVHAGGRVVEIRGEWRILPPDTAVSRTWLASQDSSAARSIALAGERGWIVRAGATTPLPPALLAEERHQFYLYSLLRLVTLRAPQVSLAPAGADSAGNVGLVVRAPGRLDVTMYFGSDGRVARLLTHFADSDGRAGDVQEVQLSGSVMVAGARWFRDLRIVRNGERYFDLHIETVAAEPTAAATWLPADARTPGAR